MAYSSVLSIPVIIAYSAAAGKPRARAANIFTKHKNSELLYIAKTSKKLAT
jgi:hypothetical protein